MRVRVLLFLSLCFLFLGKYPNVHSIEHQKNQATYSGNQQGTEILHLKPAYINPLYSLIKSFDLSEAKQQYIITTEEEEENGIFKFALTKYVIILSLAFIASYFISYLQCWHIGRHLFSKCSDKYIINRVLRI